MKRIFEYFEKVKESLTPSNNHTQHIDSAELFDVLFRESFDNLLNESAGVNAERALKSFHTHKVDEEQFRAFVRFLSRTSFQHESRLKLFFTVDYRFARHRRENTRKVYLNVDLINKLHEVGLLKQSELCHILQLFKTQEFARDLQLTTQQCIEDFLKNNILTFKEYVDVLLSLHKLRELVYDPRIQQEDHTKDRSLCSQNLMQYVDQGLIDVSDVQYVVNSLLKDKWYTYKSDCLVFFVHNQRLLQYALENHLLTEELIVEADQYIKKRFSSERHKDLSLDVDLFSYIQAVYSSKNDISSDIVVQTYLYAFNISKSEKEEIRRYVKDHPKSLVCLRQIVENNLESQYDFEMLKNTISKDDYKKKLKLNF